MLFWPFHCAMFSSAVTYILAVVKGNLRFRQNSCSSSYKLEASRGFYSLVIYLNIFGRRIAGRLQMSELVIEYDKYNCIISKADLRKGLFFPKFYHDHKVVPLGSCSHSAAPGRRKRLQELVGAQTGCL